MSFNFLTSMAFWDAASVSWLAITMGYLIIFAMIDGPTLTPGDDHGE